MHSKYNQNIVKIEWKYAEESKSRDLPLIKSMNICQGIHILKNFPFGGICIKYIEKKKQGRAVLPVNSECRCWTRCTGSVVEAPAVLSVCYTEKERKETALF